MGLMEFKPGNPKQKLPNRLLIPTVKGRGSAKASATKIGSWSLIRNCKPFGPCPITSPHGAFCLFLIKY